MTPKPRKREPELFLNRELSWLEFNHRVLEEALDPQTPLLERLKFVRHHREQPGRVLHGARGRSRERPGRGRRGPRPVGSDAVAAAPRHLRAGPRHGGAALRDAWERDPAGPRGAAASGFSSPPPSSRSPLQSLARQCRDEVFPALTPLAIDSSRPFPLLAGLSLNLAVLVGPEKEGGEARLAVVQVPTRLPRLLRPVAGDGTTYVLLEEAIRTHVGELFPGQAILETAVFRITRDSELDLDDEGGRDFLEMLEEELENRRRSGIVRLEVSAAASDALLALLAERVVVALEDVYRIPGPLDVRAFFASRRPAGPGGPPRSPAAASPPAGRSRPPR